MRNGICYSLKNVNLFRYIIVLMLAQEVGSEMKRQPCFVCPVGRFSDNLGQAQLEAFVTWKWGTEAKKFTQNTVWGARKQAKAKALA